MAQWPVRGQKAPDFWDDELHTYVDEADEASMDVAQQALVNAGAASASALTAQNAAVAAQGTADAAAAAAATAQGTANSAQTAAGNAQTSANTANTALAAKAPLASPAFTGNPTAPTPLAAANGTSIATTAYVTDAIATARAALIAGAPGLLDTFDELAAAMGDDPNFATTVMNALAAKAPLASPTFTGDPKAPTPATSDNDTSIATTAFVKAVVGALTADSIPASATRLWVPSGGAAPKVLGISGGVPAWVDSPTSTKVVTSTTRPASPANGDTIYETDTTNSLTYVSSATAWRYNGNRAVCTSTTRPTGGSLVEGLEIFESDTDKNYTYINGAWVQILSAGVAGAELGYAERTSGYNPGGTSFDVPGLAITITVGARPIWLEMGVHMSHVSGGGYLICSLIEGTTTLQRGITQAADATLRYVTAGRRLAPTAGTHTYKVGLSTDASVQLTSTGTDISYIRAVEM